MSASTTRCAGLILTVLGLLGSGIAAAQPARNMERACLDILKLSLPQTKITGAQALQVKAAYTVPGTEKGMGTVAAVDVHRSFCRVSGVVEPAIRFEVWMPIENWNGRFEGLGLGAFWGALPYGGMAEALDKGYAVGGTDTGHQSDWDDATWALTDGKLNQGLVGDWAQRGIHEMTVKSQAVVEKFFGHPAQHRYFAGCSSGGYQALTEAQRYPSDYDGILAGAPANYWTHLQAAQLSFGLATHVDPATSLEKPYDKLPLLHEAVLKACDAADGAKDGLLENPAACRFDPAVLACAGADASSCLTPPQVQAVRRLYGDIKRADGSKIFPGFPRGSELNWKLMTENYLGRNGQLAFAQTFYRYFVFQDTGWNYPAMNVERDVAYADEHIGKVLNSINPDLRPFRAHGGKLLQYHGWADWGISPYNSIDYFDAVVASVGGSASAASRREVQKFYRLFMLPGVSHCRGGDGPDTFDGLGALQAWVEKGEAPARMDASKQVDGKPVRTRPLCPYPEVAHYKQNGSLDEAANFECMSAR